MKYVSMSNGFLMCEQNKIGWSLIQLIQLSSNQEDPDAKIILATQIVENAGCFDIIIFTVDIDSFLCI